MTQFVAEICSLLIEDAYGEFFSHIFSTLTEHSRLSLLELARLCHLPSRHVRQGLAALVSLNLVHHLTAPTGQGFYSANLDSAYSLVRTGRFLRTAEDRLGKYEAEVFLQIFQLGHTKVKDLATLGALVGSPAFDKPSRSDGQKTNGVSPINGRLNGDISKRGTGTLLAALERLAEAGFIRKVRTAHFRSEADIRDEAERHVAATQVMVNSKGRKMQEEFDRAVDMEVEKRKESTFPRSTFHLRSVNGVKRGADLADDMHPRKRAKLVDGAISEVQEAEESDLGPAGDITVQANPEKFTVLMRNQRLVSFAENHLGRPTAKVYRAALRQVEQLTPRCRSHAALLAPGEPSDYSSPNLDVDNLVREIDPAKTHLDGTVAPWIPKQSTTNGPVQQPIVRRKRPPDYDRDRSDDENATDVDENGNISGVEHDSAEEDADNDFRLNNHRINGIHLNGQTSQYEKTLQHLHLLAEAPEEFLTLEYDGPIPSWYVDYRSLSAQLRNQLIFSIIADRFGQIALRLVRVMMDKGKLEEKAIQEVSLMSAKELRQILAMLKSAGFLELQEVPREAQRQPSRTIYLWFFDSERVRRKIIEDSYKSMARVLQRLRTERKKVQGVLDKAERTDVKGHEEELLSPGELNVLRSWRKMEEAMLSQLGRLDDTVTILRDF